MPQASHAPTHEVRPTVKTPLQYSPSATLLDPVHVKDSIRFHRIDSRMRNLQGFLPGRTRNSLVSLVVSAQCALINWVARVSGRKELKVYCLSGTLRRRLRTGERFVQRKMALKQVGVDLPGARSTFYECSVSAHVDSQGNAGRGE